MAVDRLQFKLILIIDNPCYSSNLGSGSLFKHFASINAYGLQMVFTVTQRKTKSKTIQWIKSRNFNIIGDR